MAEVLVKFTESIRSETGQSYAPQACGAPGGDGLWRGWIEFASGTHAMRTAEESLQPNRADLIYWAQGLSRTYLEGALARALRLETIQPPAARPPEPHFDQPAPRGR
jgi:hypothetical protein